MAPSITDNVLSTSAVKSICPGVSMTLIWVWFQVQVTAALMMLIPRCLSCGRESVTVLPSCTSPI